MNEDRISLALITEVFHGPGGGRRLGERLSQARESGAELALLPEIPLNPWSPSTRIARDEDAEAPEGPRHRLLSESARQAEIGIIGGAIVSDPSDGRRHNTALAFDASGQLVHRYQKLHLPEEGGFWETSHYRPGTLPYSVCRSFGLPFGVQICSDIMRPQGSHILAARGALAILCPRATEAATFERWELIFRSIAITANVYVISVNRPGPDGVGLGGPSIVVAPRGEVLLRTEDPLEVVELEREKVEDTRKLYPGYLPVRREAYREGWS